VVQGGCLVRYRPLLRSLLWPMYNPTFSQFQLFLLHIADLGYGIVSRDDNPL
jgi:hypothetical protein